MMKVGSLSHGEVRWNDVETAILSLMGNKTKDLKLLVHLLQCFQSDGSVGRFVLSLQVLSDFMSQYWETCFPAPGSRGQLPRKSTLIKYHSALMLHSISSFQNKSMLLKPISES